MHLQNNNTSTLFRSGGLALLAAALTAVSCYSAKDSTDASSLDSAAPERTDLPPPDLPPPDQPRPDLTPDRAPDQMPPDIHAPDTRPPDVKAPDKGVDGLVPDAAPYTCGDGTCDHKKGETVVSCKSECGWKQVASIVHTTCALRNDGTIWCWGSDSYGALGDGGMVQTGSTSTSLVNVGSLSNQATALAGGSNAFCAIKSDKTVWCWGLNNSGQLGDGKTHGSCAGGDCSSQPVQVALASTVVPNAVTCGNGGSCVVSTNNEAYCWGGNKFGRFGIAPSSKATFTTPQKVGSGVSFVAFTGEVMFLINKDQSVWVSGENIYGGLGTGEARAVKQYTFKQLTSMNGKVAQMFGLNSTFCYLDKGGVVRCWGYNGYGQLGVGSWTGPKKLTGGDGYADTPQLVTGATAVSSLRVNGWGSSGCIDSKGDAWAWGHNTYGNLGIGKTGPTQCWNTAETCSLKPQKIAVPQGTQVVYLSARHAIDAKGNLWGWGYNDHGQVGDGTKVMRVTPVKVKY